jgi:hypothetical protein
MYPHITENCLRKTNLNCPSQSLPWFFSPTCPKAKFIKIFYLFKQILSQFSLVRIQFYLWVSTKTDILECPFGFLFTLIWKLTLSGTSLMWQRKKKEPSTAKFITWGFCLHLQNKITTAIMKTKIIIKQVSSYMLQVSVSVMLRHRIPAGLWYDGWRVT